LLFYTLTNTLLLFNNRFKWKQFSRNIIQYLSLEIEILINCFKFIHLIEVNTTNYVYSNVDPNFNYSFKLTYRTVFNTSKTIYTQYIAEQIKSGNTESMPNDSSTALAISIAVPIATFCFLILIIISVTLIYSRRRGK
jgi:hypothetical protein